MSNEVKVGDLQGFNLRGFKVVGQVDDMWCFELVLSKLSQNFFVVLKHNTCTDQIFTDFENEEILSKDIFFSASRENLMIGDLILWGDHAHYPKEAFFEMEICLQSTDIDRKMIVLTINERGIPFLDKRGIPVWYGKTKGHDPNFMITLIASADPDKSL